MTIAITSPNGNDGIIEINGSNRIVINADGTVLAGVGPSANDNSLRYATTAFVQQAIASVAAVPGTHKNLVVSADGLGANVTVSADALALGSSAGAPFITTNFNVIINSTQIGANGLDTGTLTASTWYSIWVIYNPTSGATAGLLSLSTTAPTLPPGYTQFARVGWTRTDATTNKHPLGFIQRGNRVQYKVTSGTNVTSFPLMTLSGVTWPTLTPIGNYVPVTASVFYGGGLTTSAAPTTSSISLGPNPNVKTLVWPGVPANGFYGTLFTSFVLESPQTIYQGVVGSGSFTFVTGWEDNI